MSAPTIDDLDVYRKDAEVLEVQSWLTRGRCATVYMFSFSAQPRVAPFLIPSYMQGITEPLILEAVKLFLEKEKK
ncbi:MAG TPA: hypothetical protein VEC35_16340 [Noviherbaspirillum sp.]|nr:hypothetical protein [Noviherbaspirillum sp.]